MKPSPVLRQPRIPITICLQFPCTRVIDVIDAVITAEKGEQPMTSIAEETETAQAEAAGEQPKGAKKATAAKRAGNVAPKKAKSGKKATRLRRRPKAFYGAPSDTEAEKDLHTCAQQMTAGSISAIRGDLRLRSVRLRIAEEGQGMPWHLEIEKLRNSVLRENMLRLKRQQIKSKDSERRSRSGLIAEGRTEAPPPPSGTAATSRNKARLKPGFPNRASWLKNRLRERSWNKHDLARNRGPDHKTTQKMLDGFSVREDVLKKLANALCKKGAKVSVLDIPLD